MGRSRARKPKKRFDIFKVLLILLFLVCTTSGVVCRTYARYSTEETASDEARVAVWSVNANLQSDNMKITANEQYGTAAENYYMFTVTPGNTEVAGNYGVTVKLSKNGVTEWPEGLVAKVTDESGTQIGEESTDGVFNNIGQFAPGADPAKYRLYFKADYGIDCGEYDMEVTARIEQAD